MLLLFQALEAFDGSFIDCRGYGRVEESRHGEKRAKHVRARRDLRSSELVFTAPTADVQLPARRPAHLRF
jgi:hypothetical protein